MGEIYTHLQRATEPAQGTDLSISEFSEMIPVFQQDPEGSARDISTFLEQDFQENPAITIDPPVMNLFWTLSQQGKLNPSLIEEAKKTNEARRSAGVAPPPTLPTPPPDYEAPEPTEEGGSSFDMPDFPSPFGRNPVREAQDYLGDLTKFLQFQTLLLERFKKASKNPEKVEAAGQKLLNKVLEKSRELQKAMGKGETAGAKAELTGILDHRKEFAAEIDRLAQEVREATGLPAEEMQYIEVDLILEQLREAKWELRKSIVDYHQKRDFSRRDLQRTTLKLTKTLLSAVEDAMDRVESVRRQIKKGGLNVNALLSEMGNLLARCQGVLTEGMGNLGLDDRYEWREPTLDGLILRTGPTLNLGDRSATDAGDKPSPLGLNLELQGRIGGRVRRGFDQFHSIVTGDLTAGWNGPSDQFHLLAGGGLRLQDIQDFRFGLQIGYRGGPDALMSGKGVVGPEVEYDLGKGFSVTGRTQLLVDIGGNPEFLGMALIGYDFSGWIYAL